MRFKKLLTPLGAVAVFAAMGVSLLGVPRSVEAATVSTGAAPSTVTAELDANGENFTSTLPQSFVFTATPTVTLTEAAGMTAITCALGNSGQNDGAHNDRAACTWTGGNTGSPAATISMNLRDAGGQANLTNFVADGGNGARSIAIGAGRRLAVYQSPGTIAVTTVPGVTLRPTGGSPTVRVANRPVNWSVSLGVVSTRMSKPVTSFTNGSGVAPTNYRGGGGQVARDTIPATVTSLNAVGTLSMPLNTATGTTASKVVVNAPAHLTVAPTITNVSPGYQSPQAETNLAVKVTDSAGLGVNGQVVLITSNKGYILNGFDAACPGNAKAIAPTSATLAPTVGAAAESGVIQLTYCANQNDPAGNATITAQNITTTMANATQTIAVSGRPARVTATVNPTAITAKVVDATGNNVADGTPVRFTMSATADAVSTACATSSNGSASSGVASIQANATVIVTADSNETGTAATCAAPGSQQVSTSVNVSTTGTGGTGAGTFATPPVFSASGLAQVVYNGGSVAQLDAAITAAGAQGAWGQASNGQFQLYIVNGGFVNDAVRAAFPNGFAGVTALMLVRNR